jgi:hypothetical protein
LESEFILHTADVVAEDGEGSRAIEEVAAAKVDPAQFSENWSGGVKEMLKSASELPEVGRVTVGMDV